MQTPDSNELTNQYRAKTLPEGWYYFFCGAHHIGYLKYPSAEQVDYAKAQAFHRLNQDFYTVRSRLSEF